MAYVLSRESCVKTTEGETKCTELQVRKAVESVATVRTRISLGAKLAQSEGECQVMHRLVTVAPLYTCLLAFRLVPSNALALAQSRLPKKVELHLTLSLSLFLSVLSSLSLLFFLLLIFFFF